MREWLEKLAGPEYASAVLWTLLALVVLVVVLIIIRVIRSLTAGTFVVGGRNRKTRLAVMDAAAVDNHRRLVLVRRDDVEHLILIGGPTDVVVERDIRVGAAPRRPAAGAPGQPIARPRPPEAAPPPPAPQQQVPLANSSPVTLPPIAPPAPQPAPAVPAYVPHEPVRPAPAPALPPLRPAEPRPVEHARPEPAPRPAAPPRQQPAPPPAAQPAPSVRVSPGYPLPAPAKPPVSRDDIDAALMKELEVSLDEAAPKVVGPVSLDDEMTKLLGELSSKKR